MALSIDIGSKHIKIVQGVPKKDGVTVTATFNAKIPNDISVGTPESQIAAITGIIKPIFVKDKNRRRVADSETKDVKIKKQPCSITLSDDKFLIRNVVVPKGTVAEINGMALQELIGTYSVNPLSVVESMTLNIQEDGKLLVRSAALDPEYATGYYKLIQDIRQIPKSLNYHSNSIAKLMKSMPSINGTKTAGLNYMLMDCGMFSCILHVFHEGRPVQARYLPVGFSDLYYHLSRRNPLGEDADKAVVYTPNFLQTSSGYRNMPSVVTNHIENFLNRLADELAKYMRTLSLSIGSSGNIENLFLFGGNAVLEGLPERLEELLGFKVERVKTLFNVDMKPGCENIIYHLNSIAALLNS
ncbi:MAG: hypothetical protein LBS21_03735 [Clostridiales bacterium]|jgi:Tfp pilus assembly PilM family ATPase|nr:hypothetical protein [Clostridiales bacterium]